MGNLRVFQINDALANHSWTAEEWFRASIKQFTQEAPSTKLRDYDYVQVIDGRDYRRFSCGNSGSQGFRHKQTGWTIPDYCRQTGGYPEIWTKTKRKQLPISEDTPIIDYLIIHTESDPE